MNGEQIVPVEEDCVVYLSSEQTNKGKAKANNGVGLFGIGALTMHRKCVDKWQRSNTLSVAC